MNDVYSIVLKLVAKAINEDYVLNFNEYEKIDWGKVHPFATVQGVSAIVMDAIRLLPKEIRPTGNVLFQWIGQICLMENTYSVHKEAIRFLADFYSEHGFRMMLLKGYGLSTCWPVPKHRPTGDIDIFIGQKLEEPAFGRKGIWKEADRIVKKVGNQN